MANTDYNFQYTPLTGRLPGDSFVKQTEQAINELAGIVNEGAAQVKVITNLANTANDNSEVALEKATEALETSSRVYITLPNLDDADDYFDSQLYYFANSHSANLPVEDTGFLEVKTNDTKTAAEQVFIADTTGLCYFRHGDITATEVGDETVYSVTWETWSSALASEAYVQGELSNYAPLTSINPFLWQPTTEYTVGMQIKTTSLPPQCILVCTTAGTSGSTEPDYTSVSIGDTVTDGTCAWLVAENATTHYVDSKVADYLPLAGGTMTGTILSDTTFLARRNALDDEITIAGDTGSLAPLITIRGRNRATDAGSFFIRATDGTNAKEFEGKPDGTLTWNRKEVERVNASGSDYIRYESGSQICKGRVTVDSTTETTATFPVAFVSGNNTRVAVSANVATGISVTNISTTGFTCKSASASNVGVNYIAFGFWK